MGLGLTRRRLQSIALVEFMSGRWVTLLDVLRGYLQTQLWGQGVEEGRRHSRESAYLMGPRRNNNPFL